MDTDHRSIVRHYPFHIPRSFQAFFPHRLWRIPTREKRLHLSFDDGPTPGVTEQILDILREHDARATFFCTGDNAEKHPELLKRIKKEGHGIGNHGQRHLNGRKTSTEDYLRDVEEASFRIDSPYFRPPYGRMRASQAKRLSATYRIVMWEVLAGDFDPAMNPKRCIQAVIRHSRPGSILLFHDSEKAKSRVLEALPGVLEHFGERGFGFFRVEEN